MVNTSEPGRSGRLFSFVFLFLFVLLPVLGISGAAQAVPSRTAAANAPSVGAGPGVTINQAPAGAPVTPGEHIAGIEFSNSRPLAEGAVGPVPVFFADDQFGCQWTTALASGIQQWIGLARRGDTGADTCPSFQNKFNAATAAGADGLIVINFEDASVVGTAAATIPGIVVALSDGNRLKDSLVADPQQVKVTLCADGPCVPTAVSIRRFTARWQGNRVALSWTTASEVDTLAFRVWRTGDASPTRVGRASPLARHSGSVAGTTYRLVDRTARAGVSYTYRLQAIRRDGSRTWLGTAIVRTKR